MRRQKTACGDGNECPRDAGGLPTHLRQGGDVVCQQMPGTAAIAAPGLPVALAGDVTRVLPSDLFPGCRKVGAWYRTEESYSDLRS